MHELNVLIEKFWSNRMDKKELEDLKIILEERVGQAPDLYFGEKETILGDKCPEDSEIKRERILHSIHARMQMAEERPKISPVWSRKSPVSRWYWAAGAAACILLMFLSYPILKKYSNGKLPTQHIVKTQGAHFFMKIINNNSDTVANILLPDGSKSSIYPHSQISYKVPFEGNKRDINLSGMARFKVAKDPQKPFTVFSHGIATTALGTYFKVTETPKGLEIILYEGKLKIHPIHDSSAAKSTYLVGGQKLSIDSNFGYKRSLIVAPQHTQKQQPLISVYKDHRVLDTFQLDYHNTPLSDVFKNMGIKYNKVFSYNNKAALDSLPFTGHFNKADSLDALLKIICGMNHLQYEIQEHKVIIHI